MSSKTKFIPRAVHGALDFEELARLNLNPDDISDFSTNANPYGPSPYVGEAIARVRLDRYPDRECLQLRQAILQYELAGTSLPLASIVCGNGANELIWAVAHAYLEPGEKAAIIGPTFGEYAVASRASGAFVKELPAQPESGFKHALDTVLDWLDAEKPQLVWLCNPNNPTGTRWDGEEILLIAEICARLGALLTVDESYLHFVSPRETFSAVELLREERAPSLLVLRSLTKDFALAGVRLGYGVGSPAVISRVTAQLPAWNVSALAQVAGVAALKDREHLERTLMMLAQEREAFFTALYREGLYSVSSRTHFCLIEVGNAHEVRQKLLVHGILVRDCTSFGLPRYIRVATRPASEWQRLLALLREVL